jgi:mRNA-degrading endonuclease toxin of MazEF toxin-antitoxin module
MSRGDVVVVRFPHPSGGRGKKRPAVVPQSDSYSSVVNTLVVAEVTSNLMLANDPACLFIDLSTADGQATGLTRDSVVSCLVLVTVYNDAVDQVLGSLSPALMQRLNDCLKVALALP